MDRGHRVIRLDVYDWMFQWSHFLSEMDRRIGGDKDARMPGLQFQWSHFLSEMDRCFAVQRQQDITSFNGATSFQKWIGLFAPSFT